MAQAKKKATQTERKAPAQKREEARVTTTSTDDAPRVSVQNTASESDDQQDPRPESLRRTTAQRAEARESNADREAKRQAELAAQRDEHNRRTAGSSA